ncbi:hypothetical protein R5W24_002008 [Gemmata sp. JC717]|nr:hypothetical protein [Gemmata algarum]MDY3552918.1 hypothetical protein [Gemmata algarum]
MNPTHRTRCSCFDPHIVENRELITGQNPRSDKPLAAKLIQALARVAGAV